MIKKTHKKTSKTLTSNCHLLRFGSCGFKLLNSVRLETEQLNSLKRSLTKKLKNLSSHSKDYKLWILLKPNKTLTKLSLESRMGKGKGAIYTEAVFLKKGTIIYEFQNLSPQQISEVLCFSKKQLSVNLTLIQKK